MRLTLIALAALAAAIASPAAACGSSTCFGAALADDSYPPGDLALSPTVERMVTARQGKGLSLAGFYNDPSLALAPHYAPARYDYAPPPVQPDYVEAPPAPVEYGYDRHHRGPRVILSPFGHRRHFAHEAPERGGHHIY